MVVMIAVADRRVSYLSFARVSAVFAYSCQIELQFCLTDLPAEEVIVWKMNNTV